MMARILDPGDDDPDDFDASELLCPKCGCNAVTVLSFPRGDAPRKTADGKWTGRWFGSQGRARCDFCNVTFTITASEDQPEEDETRNEQLD